MGEFVMNFHIKTNNKILIGLVFIIIIGGLIRVYRLDTESIWFDEGLAIYGAMNSSMFVDPEDLNPPFYHFLLHYWIYLFGNSEFSVRLPSVIFNLLSIVIIFKLGKALFNNRVGLISSLLLSFSWYNIKYSQEARPYSLMILLTLCSFYLLVQWSEKQNVRRNIAYLIFSCLLIYTHTYGIFIIIAQNIWFITTILFSKEKSYYKIKNWIILQILLGLLYLPWVHFLFEQINKFNTLTFINTPDLSTVLTVFTHYAGSTLALMVCLIVILLFIKNQIIIDKLKNNINHVRNSELAGAHFNAIYLLLLWIIIPNLIPFILSFILHPVYFCRYTISASLGFYILIAVTLDGILSKPVQVSIIALLLVLSSYSITKYYRVHSKKQEWREAAAYVDSNAYSKDIVIFSAGFPQRYVFDYYSTRNDIDKKPFPKESISSIPESARDITKKNLKKLIKLVEGYIRVWLIMSQHHDHKGSIRDTLEKHYDLIAKKKYYGGIDIYLFQNNQINEVKRIGKDSMSPSSSSVY